MHSQENIVPIVYIHFGDCHYISDTIAVTKKYNDKVYLLTDTPQSYQSIGCDVLDATKIVSTNADRFRQLYVHLNTTDANFEFNCFKRWFVLYEFMKANNIESCMYCDSDCMLTENVTKIRNGIGANKQFISGTKRQKDEPAVSPHCVLINGRSALADFLKYVMNTYVTNKDELRRIKQEVIGPIGGICDMTLFDMYRKSHPTSFILLSDPIWIPGEETEYVYDHNISVMEQYEGFNKMKKLYKRDDGFYANIKSMNKKRKLCCIHCQGGAKQHIRAFRQTILGE